MIFIIDDDRPMAECIAAACRSRKNRENQENQENRKSQGDQENREDQKSREDCDVKIFSNAISAISALDESENLPSLIFLDVLLDGPDGFTLLHELASYSDTAKIPIVIVSSLNLPSDLSAYGIRKVLDKSTMTPTDIINCLEEYC